MINTILVPPGEREDLLEVSDGILSHIQIIESPLCRQIVDPIKPSKYRSKRIWKKLRKRLGPPVEQDFAYLINDIQDKIRDAFMLDPQLLEEKSTFDQVRFQQMFSMNLKPIMTSRSIVKIDNLS